MAVDLTSVTYFLPLLGFLVVFILGFVVIQKSKLTENKFTQSILAFIIAVVFVSASAPTGFILALVPWFAVLIVGMFFVLLIGGFVDLGVSGDWGKGVGKIFVYIFGLVFVVTAFFVFYPYFGPYFYGGGGNPAISRFIDWITSPKVGGSLLLVALGVILSFIMIGKAKK